jgi:hypothetical protein
MLVQIVSGGQTGVDRAALDVALELGLPCGGWCPRGRLAEDGPIPARYPLRETPSPAYTQRTEWNVRDSDGTLVLTPGEPAGGTALTVALAEQLGKPLLVIDLTGPVRADDVRKWLQSQPIRILNVAGPRESEQPGVQARATAFLREGLSGKSGIGGKE